MSGHTTFSKELFAAFQADNREGPVQLLNLIKLHETAVCTSGERVKAYATYGRISAGVFAELGGKIIWRGRWELGLIEPEDELGNTCFIAEYPSVASFVGMTKNPIYREALVHRTAAVQDSRLIRLAPAESGATFHMSNLR